jgi:hypothetical protein
MSGETKQRLSDLEVENAELRQRLLDRPSLRDQFAMAALTGTITRSATYFGIEEFSSFAAWSYEIADEMMKARHAKD